MANDTRSSAAEAVKYELIFEAAEDFLRNREVDADIGIDDVTDFHLSQMAKIRKELVPIIYQKKEAHVIVAELGAWWDKHFPYEKEVSDVE